MVRRAGEWNGTVRIGIALFVAVLLFFGNSNLRAQGLVFDQYTTIDFGRVKVGQTVDSFFVIKSEKPDSTSKYHVSAFRFDNSDGSAFTYNPAPDKNVPVLQTGTTYHIHFKPTQDHLYNTNITVENDDPYRLTFPLVLGLHGRGIAPNVQVGPVDFGYVLNGQSSDTLNIPIQNIGSDTISVPQVKFIAGDVGEFVLIQNSLPSASAPFFLDTFGSKRADTMVRVVFTPHQSGSKQVFIEVSPYGAAPQVIQLTGHGDTRSILIDSSTLDFGDLEPPLIGSYDSTRTRVFHFHNLGSVALALDSVTLSPLYVNGVEDDLDTVFRLWNASGTLQPVSNTADSVLFHISRTGDFKQYIILVSQGDRDTLGVLRAKVRTTRSDLYGPDSLGVIVDCDPKDTTFTIHNPYASFGLTIDSLTFKGDVAGFEMNNSSPFVFPIRISPDSSFSFRVRYLFPQDSLNGAQTTNITIYQRTGLANDVVTHEHPLSLVREVKLDTLTTVAPSFTPSAGDFAPFRLPIYLSGPHEGVPMLDNLTLKLKFSNPLFQPIGIDRTGSLTEGRSGDGSEVSWGWDEVNQQDTIRATGLHISKDKSNNRLLITVLVRAYLSLDTTASVRTALVTDEPMCAYRVATAMIPLKYANDCGDETIRAAMQGGNFGFLVGPPVYTFGGDGKVAEISLDYTSRESQKIMVHTFDLSGHPVGGNTRSFLAEKGAGKITFAAQDFPSGPLFLQFISQSSTAGKAPISVKVEFKK